MNKEKLKAFREKVDIPLIEALSLLKQNNDDIEQSIAMFHQNRLNEICLTTGCNETLAKAYYTHPVYQQNVEKIIEKIDEFNRRPIKLTIAENPKYVNKVGFFIWAEDENLVEVQHEKNRTYFIPQDDFAYVIEIFKSIFPLWSLQRNEFEGRFDPCSVNYFDYNAVQKIVSDLRDLSFEDIKIMNFLEHLACCLEEKIQIGTYVIVFGNQ
ncbi:hypothetical protein [Acinetobacter nematophilus]|uniref:Uncharacterized protein n=1 Tax=Acinetobacter nematophilus TaxID=2994642 RepID=A0A9X3DT43_9GAMM|nr:hypothetical protein [Acinetobacter nematophilus]MCX5466631.1 hypothetical protein [Acinetobacter nematophilus]